MADTEATQSTMTGIATQSSITGIADGSGAPKDAPPAERTYSHEQAKAFAAKEKRVGDAQGRKALLDLHGVTSEEELAELVTAGREAKPKPKATDAERIAEKLKGESEKREAVLQAQLSALQQERDTALLRSSVERVLANAGLVEGAGDLVLSAFGLAPGADVRLVVKDGQVAVVDRDGDPIGTTVEKAVKEFVAKRLYLQSPLSQDGGTRTTPSSADNGKPKRRLTAQEEVDELARFGQASVSRTPR